jgi:Uma2 family endonuclease
MVTLQLQQLSVPPGHRVILHDISWQEFEAILAELGDRRATRLAYSQGTVEMRMPLPKHQKAKVIIGDLLKILLEELEIDCYCHQLNRESNKKIYHFPLLNNVFGFSRK